MKTDTKPLSKCCRAAVKVGGDEREGTHYYVCTKCGEPCDAVGDGPVPPSPLDEIVRRGAGECYSGECMTLNEAVAHNERILRRTFAELLREAKVREALSRAIQHVPGNAIDARAAMTRPINECRTLDFCERTLATLTQFTAGESPKQGDNT